MPATPIVDRAFVHRADDLDTYLTFFTNGRAVDGAVEGEVRARSGGRLQIVTRNVRRTSVPITLRDVSSADLETFESWAGVKLLYRDHLGTFLWCTFFTWRASAYKDRSGHDVAVTFVRATGTEVV